MSCEKKQKLFDWNDAIVLICMTVMAGLLSFVLSVFFKII